MWFSQMLDTLTSNGPMLKISCIFAGALIAPLFSASLTLINDSNFPLIGEIYNAAGDKEDAIKLFPGQTYLWYRDDSPFNKQYDRPTMPFTVRFLCHKSRPYDYNPPPKKKEKRAVYQSEFGSWDNVPTGGTVNALGVSNGPKSCIIKEGAKSRTAPPQEPRNYKNEGQNNWSNDGGQTWTNDATSGFDDFDTTTPPNK